MPTIVSAMNFPLCGTNGDAAGCPDHCQMTTEQLCELHCLHVEMFLSYFFNFVFRNIGHSIHQSSCDIGWERYACRHFD